MIFQLFWEKILRPFKEVFLPLFLFFACILFWYFKPFGQSFLNSIFAFGFFAFGLYFYLKKPKESILFLVFLDIFLAYFAIYNLALAFSFPLWLPLILIFFFTFLFFSYLGNSLFSLSLSFIISEISLVLNFWPTNPFSKSFILLSVFYLFWGVVLKGERVLNYLILVGFILLLVLLTTNWRMI